METHIEFTHSLISPPKMQIGLKEVGAQVEFLGIVREFEDGRPIPGLHYEAHETMARSIIEKILSDVTALYSCEEIWLIHRLDYVPVGETALFIRIHSRHRQSALRMLEAVIDRMKTDAPIWKL
ncbi:MAG: molybdenum cofactor biosynthesis protein MoaE [Terracidiphilus sp.]|jgi:molybdopterin synthase catalytic subunit